MLPTYSVAFVDANLIDYNAFSIKINKWYIEKQIVEERDTAGILVREN